MVGVYTIVKPAAENGWGASRTLLLGALSLGLLAGFLAREATARDPLIPPRIFRSRNVTGANVIQILGVAGMFGMFFLGALYCQRVLRYNALQTGLAFLPAPPWLSSPRRRWQAAMSFTSSRRCSSLERVPGCASRRS